MEKWKILRFLRISLCAVVWSLTEAAGLLEFYFIRAYVRGRAALRGLEAGENLALEEWTSGAGAFAVLLAPVLLTLLTGAVIFTVYCVRKGKGEIGEGGEKRGEKRGKKR